MITSFSVDLTTELIFTVSPALRSAPFTVTTPIPSTLRKDPASIFTLALETIPPVIST